MEDSSSFFHDTEEKIRFLLSTLGPGGTSQQFLLSRNDSSRFFKKFAYIRCIEDLTSWDMLLGEGNS